ncbi:dihydroneopterin aldolase [Turicimonas muris]|uniref:dihydroneopterin aldolase n=1 Tax=Turicimonas muris TaxID=1796652 RepID=UPI0023EFCEDF|nr:dihydroneopterin aldolase [Turicimonas muris]
MRIEDFLLCSGKYSKTHLTDYVLDVAIGAYDSERKGKQSVRFNVEAWVENLPVEDDLSNVYNYEEIIGSIKEVLSKGHIDLQETLAASVAKQVLSNPMVKAVKVKTEKLDVLTDSASFGIEIFVEQHDQN